MRYIVIPEPTTSHGFTPTPTPTPTLHLPQRRRRINFLAAVVVLQILSSWLLVK
ncbi:hypothetical protein HMI55_007377 [Coelomomyces lativittatus]|nr:hypothetical protein HMI55_007377 [Coelomomyces lativittatus]